MLLSIDLGTTLMERGAERQREREREQERGRESSMPHRSPQDILVVSYLDSYLALSFSLQTLMLHKTMS